MTFPSGLLLMPSIKNINKSSTQEIAIGINNLTNRKNPFFMKYDPQTDGLKTVHQFAMMPDLIYGIVFSGAEVLN